MPKTEPGIMNSKHYIINVSLIFFLYAFFVFYYADLKKVANVDSPYRLDGFLIYMGIIIGGMLFSFLSTFCVYVYEQAVVKMANVPQYDNRLTKKFSALICLPIHFSFYYKVLVLKQSAIMMALLFSAIMAGVLATGFQVFVLENKTKTKAFASFFTQLIWGFGCIVGVFVIQLFWMAIIMKPFLRIIY
jgi:hypothetical protein